jgi:hypothetical protein
MILCHGNLPAFTETMGKNWKQLVAALGLELREVERRAGGKDRTVARHFLNIYIYMWQGPLGSISSVGLERHLLQSNDEHLESH